MLVYAHFVSAQIRLPFENEYFKYVHGWNKIFTCFYMPAFFIISGYCSSLDKNIKSFLTSIGKSLIIPLICFSFISDILWVTCVSHNNLYITIKDSLLRGGSLWFINALIIAKIICYIMNKLFHHNTILILTFCFLILGVLLNQYHLGENFIFYKHGLIASFFFAVGIFYKNNEKYFLSSMNISFYIYPFISLTRWRN